MYCRNCFYDLRGQEISRCPECGLPFALDDATSFLSDVPGILGQTLLWLRRRRKFLIIVMTILWLMCNYQAKYLYNFGCGGIISYGIVACNNLKNVITARKVQAFEYPESKSFDIEDAKKNIQPSLSAWSERDAVGHRLSLSKKLRFVPQFAIPAILYLLLFAVLYERRLRRGAIVLAAGLLLIVCGSLFPQEIVTRVYPGSYAFLDDIVHIPGIDLTVYNENTIIAYDLESFRWNGQRVVAFADGHTVHRQGDWAKPLFQAQGIPYPEPSGSQ